METIDKKIIRNEAAKAGALFGLASGLYGILSLLLKSQGVIYILDFVKIAGLILLMRYCMKRLHDSYAGVNSSSLRSYGTHIALFSAIITAAFYYVSYQHFFPDAVTALWDQIYIQLGSTMDKNTRLSLQWTENNFSTIVLISQFIYCFLYGWVLSLILAPRVLPSDPFTEND